MLQLTGRVGIHFIAELEAPINKLLEENDIEIRKLSGYWRRTNPVVNIGQVVLSSGHLTDVTLEIDLLESLAKNRFVARNLEIDSGHIEFDSGIRELINFRQSRISNPFLDFFYFSDKLEIKSAVSFTSSQKKSNYSIRYIAVNESGGHHHQLEAKFLYVSDRNRKERCVLDCSLLIDFYDRDGIEPFMSKRRQFVVKSNDFHVPTSVFGVSDLILRNVDLHWVVENSLSSSQIVLEIKSTGSPYRVEQGALQIAAEMEGVEGKIHGILRQLKWLQKQVDQPGNKKQLILPEIPLKLENGIAELHIEQMDLKEGSDFVRAVFSSFIGEPDFLRKLNIEGEASDIWVRVNINNGIFGYASIFDNLSLDAWNGIPEMRGGSGKLVGFNNGLQFNLASSMLTLRWPKTFPDKWDLGFSKGKVRLWFNEGYVGIRGTDLEFSNLDQVIKSSFSLARPLDSAQRQLSISASIENMPFDTFFAYLPQTMPRSINNWLRGSLIEGDLNSASVAYQGHLSSADLPFSNRFEIRGGLKEARISYHDRWPVVQGLVGEVVMSGATTRLKIAKAKLFPDIELGGTQVLYERGNGYVDIVGRWDISMSSALELVRVTPLQDQLTFIEPDWIGFGPITWSGDIRIPFLENIEDDSVEVELEVNMNNVELNIPAYALDFRGLMGEVDYKYPISINSSNIKGSLFGRPVDIYFESDGLTTALSFSGTAGDLNILDVLDLDNTGLLKGDLDFSAELLFFKERDKSTRLNILSDLLGLEVMLPSDLHKEAGASAPFNAEIEFLSQYNKIEISYGLMRSWFHMGESGLRGSLGFNVAPIPFNKERDLWSHITLTGDLGLVQLDNFSSEALSFGDSFFINIANLRLEKIGIGSTVLLDTLVNGDIGSGNFAINVVSPDVDVKFSGGSDRRVLAIFDYLNLPVVESTQIDLGDNGEIPELVVRIKDLHIGNTSYGKWNFNLASDSKGLNFKHLDASINGLMITSEPGLVWNLNSNETRFSGEVKAQDIADVLPLWGYVPTVDAKDVSVLADVRWFGNPLEIQLLDLIGSAKLQARDGRFVDIESGGGAVRILSLINFNAIAKRLRGDFSDVTGKGIAFDNLEAELGFNNGILSFVDTLKLRGTGSSFEVDGTIDLDSGRLDNEMIVTLPVTKSLPWYGLYLALANPIAGAGVLVGERVLRKPLEQVSSAKYSLRGTLAAPELKLLDLVESSEKLVLKEEAIDKKEDVKDLAVEQPTNALADP